jgi:hypothetical protein
LLLGAGAIRLFFCGPTYQRTIWNRRHSSLLYSFIFSETILSFLDAALNEQIEH